MIEINNGNKYGDNFKAKTIIMPIFVSNLSQYDIKVPKNKEFISHNTNAISKKGKDNVYCVTYNFSTARNILKWLYKDCKICLIRKYNRAKEVTKI